MRKTGVLLHVYHLKCEKWERLVWGDPSQDKLGVGTKLFELFLTEPADQEMATIMYNGPSNKDGFAEGEYTRQFLLDRVDRVEEFPRFQKLFANATDEQRAAFHRRVLRMSSGEKINNTREEIVRAAKHFQAWDAGRVIHIAAVNHAPRCVQLQAIVRETGLIPAGQQWFTVTSDISFAGRVASDTAIIEPPHRADDPLLGFEPMMPAVLHAYLALPPEQKKEFIRRAEQSLHDLHTREKHDGAKLAAEAV